METYKATVKDKIRQAKLQLGNDFGDEEMMEEVIFKAGQKLERERITKELRQHWTEYDTTRKPTLVRATISGTQDEIEAILFNNFECVSEVK